MNGEGLPCSPVIQVGSVSHSQTLTDQPAKHPSRFHSPCFCPYPVFPSFPLTLPPSAWIPDPFISIHYRDSFMHGRETPPSSRVWRQTEGEGHKGGESQRGNGERVGGGVEVKGHWQSGEGVKNCKYRLRFIPCFKPWSLQFDGASQPLCPGCSEAGFPPLCRGEASSHKRRITLALSSRGWSEGRGAGPGHLHR